MCPDQVAYLHKQYPNLAVRTQSFLYSEEALRALGLARARYMLSLSARESAILFSKTPMQLLCRARRMLLGALAASFRSDGCLLSPL